MFAKFFNALLVLSAVLTIAIANPISTFGRHGSGISFNNYGHLSSLRNFDNFYGRNNFIGRVSHQTFVETDEHLVCRTQSVEIIQQRLLVIQELAKRVITEQVCDVETQTVVFEQFHSSFGNFRHDLHRTSGLRVGFDRGISNHFNDIFEHDGSLSTHDFGFTGHDLGRQTVAFGGSNWNDHTSPASVFSAYSAARQATFH